MITVKNETPSEVIRDTLNDVSCSYRNAESNSVVNGAGVSYAVIDKTAKSAPSDPGDLQEVATHGGKSQEAHDNLGPTHVTDDLTRLNEEQSDSAPVYTLSQVVAEELPCPEELKAKPPPEGTDVLAEESSNSSNHISEIQNLATQSYSSASRCLSSVALVTWVILLLT